MAKHNQKGHFLDYIYIDEKRLDVFYQQLPNPGIFSGRFNWKVALSLTGAQIETSRESKNEFSVHEKIDRLMHHLERNDYVSKSRPRSFSEKKSFVFETMNARKLIVPSSYTEKIDGVKSLAVWISDPLEEDLSEEKWNFNGCFTYLTQLHLDDEENDMMTGCSALQALVNLAVGTPFPFRSGTRGEPLGRGESEHPVTKLEKLGWQVTDTRRITSLYRIRYMTNEQVYKVNSKAHRVHDLLGYPIFIAASL